MITILRLLERLAVVAALACGVGFCFGPLGADRIDPAIPVEPARIDLASSPSVGTIRVKERRPVAIEFANPTGQPRQILGVARSCGWHVCYEGIVAPTTIPPHGSGSILVDVKGTSVGPIFAEVTIYTDVGNPGEMTVLFSGQVVAAGDGTSAPSRSAR